MVSFYHLEKSLLANHFPTVNRKLIPPDYIAPWTTDPSAMSHSQHRAMARVLQKKYFR